jgi:hypothetical protein
MSQREEKRKDKHIPMREREKSIGMSLVWVGAGEST